MNGVLEHRIACAASTLLLQSQEHTVVTQSAVKSGKASAAESIHLVDTRGVVCTGIGLAFVNVCGARRWSWQKGR